MYSYDPNNFYQKRALEELKKIDNNFVRAMSQLGNEVYKASCIYEQYEHRSDGKMDDNGHHIRQHLAFVSQCILFDRWRSDVKYKLFGDRTLCDIARRWRADAATMYASKDITSKHAVVNGGNR